MIEFAVSLTQTPFGDSMWALLVGHGSIPNVCIYLREMRLELGSPAGPSSNYIPTIMSSAFSISGHNQIDRKL